MRHRSARPISARPASPATARRAGRLRLAGAATALAVLAGSGLAVAIGSSSAAGSAPTLFGSSIHQNPGESFTAAYQRRVAEFGALPVDRVYYSGLPKAWPGNAGYGSGAVVVSFKASPQQVLTGAYDATLANWFATAPTTKAIYWTYFHEPENDVERGAFTPAQFTAAYQRISALADRAHKPNLHATLILMCYTLSPYSHRSFASYYPGSAAVDVLGWDCYNQSWKKGAYADAASMFANVLSTSASTGKPFGVAEFGSQLIAGDSSGAGRAAWLKASGSYLAAHHAAFVTYFDSPVSNDYRLRDAASIAAWRSVVALS